MDVGEVEAGFLGGIMMRGMTLLTERGTRLSRTLARVGEVSNGVAAMLRSWTVIFGLLVAVGMEVVEVLGWEIRGDEDEREVVEQMLLQSSDN